MLMALQFQGFKRGETLGFSAQETGGSLFRSRLNKDRFASLDYSQRGTSIDLNQVFIPSSRSFIAYPRNLSWPRSQAKLESKPPTWMDGWCSNGFVERLRRHSYERWCRFRFYVPFIISPIRISFFRELYRVGYDLIKTIISKLKY